jgi:RND family efflux transporter MFP subunit
MARLRPHLVVAGSCLMVVVGCGQPNQYQPPPRPTVTVAQPVRKTVTTYLVETGTTEPVEEVEIRARVKGFIDEVKFEAGTVVEKDEMLYQIEPEQFQAQVDAAQAEVRAQEARRDKTKIERDRQVNLQEKDPGATSEVAVVAARAEYDGAEAGVKAAQAALDRANLDLQYTTVVAPIGGRVGKTWVKQGNLVGDSEATLLTDIINYDPIYANFNISENSLLDIRERTKSDDQTQQRGEDLRLYLKRGNDEGFPFEGRFDYADLAVDQSMGTFLIRGIFANPNRDIVPGLFVSVRIPIGEEPDALLVPERATGSDQAGDYVLVVNRDEEIERRDVTLGTKVGDLVVVSNGLQADQWVVIDGLQRARPGVKVEQNKTELTPPGGELESVKQGSGVPPDQAEVQSEAGDELPADAQGNVSPAAQDASDDGQTTID